MKELVIGITMFFKFSAEETDCNRLLSSSRT